MFAIHLLKRQLDPAHFDIPASVKNNEGFTGVEIEQAIVSARYSAQASDTVASTELVLEELARTQPLSVAHTEDIASLHHRAADRTASAG